jgi:chromosome segregation ATPase
MVKKDITLSVTEEIPIEVPEEIQRIGTEAWQILWQTSRQLAQQEVEKTKKKYQQREFDLSQQRQTALDRTAAVEKEIAAAGSVIESLTRETKSLQVDLNQRTAELKSAQDQALYFKETVFQQEYEIKRVIEESGRLRESIDGLKKRLHEVSHQAELDRTALEESHEENAGHLRINERLEKSLKVATEEIEQIRKQFRNEQTRATIAETLVQELRETIRKLEIEIHQLRAEKQELKNNMETEVAARVELEKKIAVLNAKTESQEWAYKDTISRLEQELTATKEEATNMRNRIIKTEGALEREKKAIERLETKLVAAGGKKF